MILQDCPSSISSQPGAHGSPAGERKGAMTDSKVKAHWSLNPCVHFTSNVTAHVAREKGGSGVASLAIVSESDVDVSVFGAQGCLETKG
jgi:hypothetical protein